jgi:hypothetical protein
MCVEPMGGRGLGGPLDPPLSRAMVARALSIRVHNSIQYGIVAIESRDTCVSDVLSITANVPIMRYIIAI